MMQLHEKYRPSTWSDVVGQDKAIAKVRAVGKRGYGGRAFWVSGQSGTGKTTIARLIAAEIADSHFVQDTDAGDLTVANIDKLDVSIRYYAFGNGKTGRAYIFNEAHALRKLAIQKLLVLLESIPDHVVIIFTTTVDGQDKLFEDQMDAHPLLSRCICLSLARRDIARPMAERCKQIAALEGLDGQPLDKYVKLSQKCGNNMREMLQHIDAGEMAQ